MRRVLARTLSFYQRAPAHLLADLGWGNFDWMASSLLRALLLRMCGRRTRYWRAQHLDPPPSSGWWGSALVLVVWTGLIAAVQALFPLLPAYRPG